MVARAVQSQQNRPIREKVSKPGRTTRDETPQVETNKSKSERRKESRGQKRVREVGMEWNAAAGGQLPRAKQENRPCRGRRRRRRRRRCSSVDEGV